MVNINSVSKDYSAIHIEPACSDSEEHVSPGQMLNRVDSVCNESEDLLPQTTRRSAERGFFSRCCSGLGALCRGEGARGSDNVQPESRFGLSGRNMLLLAGGTLVTAGALLCYIRHAQTDPEPLNQFPGLPEPEAFRQEKGDLLDIQVATITKRNQSRYGFGLG